MFRNAALAAIFILLLAQPTHRRVVRHNTDVPVGSEKTDKFTAISLELAF